MTSAGSLSRPPSGSDVDVRAAELHALATLLAADARLVTLVGPVGVGKSWVAARAAANAVAAGVVTATDAGEPWLSVDLEGAASLDDVLACVAGALGLAARDATDPARERRRIAAALEQRGDVLLVLDGADDALEALRSPWLDEVLRATEAQVIVTARARLGVAAEHVVAIEPLAVPTGSELDAPAARFFLERVRARVPTYAPSPAEVPVVAELVRELDGLPLAMALAAPRLALMGVLPLLHRLRSSRSILRGKTPSASPRHQSFDAALEGSWQALQPWEQAALVGLTAFATFDVESAEATLDLSAHASPAIVDVLEALRDRSLLADAGSEGGAVRWRVLASVADFVRRRAGPASVAEARDRHARCFGERAHRWCEALEGPASRDALAAIDRERDNLMFAIRRALVAGPMTVREAEPALWSLLALAPGLEPHPTLAAHAPILEGVLQATQKSGADPTLLARAFGLRSVFRRRAGDLAGATRDLDRALRLAQSLGATTLDAALHGELAMVVEASGDLDGAAAQARDAVARFGALGMWSDEARALLVLARLEGTRGDAKRAKAVALRALALSEAHGLVREEARARVTLAGAAIDLGASDEARAALVRARAIDPRLRAACDELEARARHDEGELSRAAELYAASASTARREGLVAEETRALLGSALIALERRSFAEAYAHLTVAIEIADAGAKVADAGTSSALLRALLSTVATLDADAGTPTGAARSAPCGPIDRAVVTFLASAPTALEAAREALLAAWPESARARLIARAVERAHAAPGAPTKLPAHALIVGTGARWFRLPGAEPVSLERRRPLAAMLEHLAIARAERPGVSVSSSDLTTAAWPGERMLAAAAAHRVRVAISTLRKLGLRERLVTTPEGYALDSSVPLHRAADPPSLS